MSSSGGSSTSTTPPTAGERGAVSRRVGLTRRTFRSGVTNSPVHVLTELNVIYEDRFTETGLLLGPIITLYDEVTVRQ